MLENVEKEYGVYVIGGDLADVLDNLFPSYEEALDYSKTLTGDKTVVVEVVQGKEEE